MTEHRENDPSRPLHFFNSMLPGGANYDKIKINAGTTDPSLAGLAFGALLAKKLGQSARINEFREGLGLPPRYQFPPFPDEEQGANKREQIETWEPISKKFFYFSLDEYHNSPIGSNPPSVPDGRPPANQDQQYKYNIGITWCTMCEELEELIDELEPSTFRSLFGGDIPIWLMELAGEKNGSPITEPTTGREKIYNEVISFFEKSGYPPFFNPTFSESIKNLGNMSEAFAGVEFGGMTFEDILDSYNNLDIDEIYNNFLGLLNDLYDDFCPCRNELPDDFINYLMAEYDISNREQAVSRILGTKWRKGFKSDQDGNRDPKGNYVTYSPPEGSPNPFY